MLQFVFNFLVIMQVIVGATQLALTQACVLLRRPLLPRYPQSSGRGRGTANLLLWGSYNSVPKVPADAKVNQSQPHSQATNLDRISVACLPLIPLQFVPPIGVLARGFRKREEKA